MRAYGQFDRLSFLLFDDYIILHLLHGWENQYVCTYLFIYIVGQCDCFIANFLLNVPWKEFENWSVLVKICKREIYCLI